MYFFNYFKNIKQINVYLFIFIIFIYLFNDLIFTDIIYCEDGNNNNHWFWDRPIGFYTTPRSIANISINTGISYVAFRGATYASSNLAGAPIPVRIGAFGATYGVIYLTRTAFSNYPIFNLNVYISNSNNNDNGNRFYSILENGEALDSFKIFIDSIIGFNIIMLITFNLLIMILINRTIGHKILEWLKSKIGKEKLIYKILERTYKANMKVSIWLIGYIIILIYICILMGLWGIYTIKIGTNMIIDNIEKILSNKN